MRETERESDRLSTLSAPSLDAVFEILSARRRRYVLYSLHEAPEGVASIEDVAERVSLLERSDGDESRFAEVRTSLCHVHLPKLEDAGFVEYDSRSETVRYWPQPSLEEWLEHARHKELE